jgi:hypothetical protein
MDELAPYKTSDTPFAIYLTCMGMTILDTIPDKVDPHRQVFVFVDDPAREEYEANYKNGEDWVSAREFERNRKKLMRIIIEKKERSA